MKVEYTKIPKDEIARLPELGKEGWITSIVVDSVIVLYREIPKSPKRAEKKSEAFPEYLEFRSAYPRKDGTASDAFIAKYRKLTDEGLHPKIMLSVVRHSHFWEKSNLAAGRPKDNAQFIPHADTWLNQKRWNDEVKDAFVPESKTKVSKLEELTAHLDEKTRKTVSIRAKQYLEDHPNKEATPLLILQLVEKYG